MPHKPSHFSATVPLTTHYSSSTTAPLPLVPHFSLGLWQPALLSYLFLALSSCDANISWRQQENVRLTTSNNTLLLYNSCTCTTSSFTFTVDFRWTPACLLVIHLGFLPSHFSTASYHHPHPTHTSYLAWTSTCSSFLNALVVVQDLTCYPCLYRPCFSLSVCIPATLQV